METVLNTKEDLKAGFLSQFQHVDTPLNHRKEAIEDLINIQTPTTKDEFWKYTRVNKILKQTYNFSESRTTQTDILKSLPLNQEQSILVFVNGVFAKEYSKIIDASIDFAPFHDKTV